MRGMDADSQYTEHCAPGANCICNVNRVRLMFHVKHMLNTECLYTDNRGSFDSNHCVVLMLLSREKWGVLY